jgi:hypothetical protein
MSTADARARLAQGQEELVRALTTQSGLVSEFDTARLSAAAASLQLKRAKAVCRVWRALSASLGDEFDALFSAYADRNPLPSDGGPIADGRGFARFLARQGLLPEAARLEAFLVDLHYSTTARGLVPRRGIAVKVGLGRKPVRVFVGCHVPFLGVRWIALPLFWFATSTSRTERSPSPPADRKPAKECYR